MEPIKTEPIKQEIINNIFENGDKLITGPILQTVLIDMIDDVNVKDQEILSKTGSWDEAVTQIPNLATKAEVTNLSESIARDLENVVDVDLTGYATEQWVQDQGYLTEHQDISNLATKGELNAAENNLQGNITSLSESVARDLENVEVDLTGYATETWVQSQDYASKSYVDNAVSSSSVDLTGYATETWVESQGYLKEHQDISNLATKSELTSVSESVQTDITNLSESVATSAVWKKGTRTDSIVQAIADGTNLPTATGERAIATGKNTIASGQSSHAEGTGTNASGYYSHAEGSGTTAKAWYSHAEGMHTSASGESSHAEGSNTKASGTNSHAEGSSTKASGQSSHAEGSFTEALGSHSHAEGNYAIASGSWSHAEGQYTVASGSYSHAEGYYTKTSNDYEHAQGRYNHSSENQIFSIGAGEWGDISNTQGNRRNAISVLAVPNADTKINTASFFVQNIGGYDGTNPLPGTNDLATVINGMSTGGGSSETLWKKGTGQDSMVQVLTDVTYPPTATGTGSIATGYSTKASGTYSHAEGYYTKASGESSHAEGYFANASGPHSHAEGYSAKASGSYSHAEGNYANASGNASHAEGYSTDASRSYSHAEGYDTVASGQASHTEGIKTTASGNYSHAEGCLTSTTNQYEHAQGIANHNSTNQIFSVGAGEIDNPYRPDSTSVKTRKNALSVLAVPNADTQVVTASFFVQNVGGYDGTNPLPGTNDLATVLNNTETWTFTLEDGSTVTKSILMR